MIYKISILEYLQKKVCIPILDVRSEGEFKKAHFPGSISFPIFSDVERSVIGTLYKQRSKKEAIIQGLQWFGPKMVEFVKKAEILCPEMTVVLYCWRGGMRSGGMAWLLNLYGFEVYTISGGYKSFRRWCLGLFENSYPIAILGGFTGSRKTKILQKMQLTGEVVIDLEALASHKGSTFGAINMPEQPSQEMFENRLACQLYYANHSCQSNPSSSKLIWMEDESQRIGDINIPLNFFFKMRNAPVYFLSIPFYQRVENIFHEYGNASKELLINCTMRIAKRLGGLETKKAIMFLENGETKKAFEILLAYYDKWYIKAAEKHRPERQLLWNEISVDHLNEDGIIQKLINYARPNK